MAWLFRIIDDILLFLFPMPSVDNDPIVPVEVVPEEAPQPSKLPPLLTLYYETKPFTVTQPWGVYDPETYRKYGYDRHSGIDIAHGANGRIRAPFDCTIIGTQYQTGGGRVLSILSDKEYLFPDGDVAFVRIDYLHLKSYIETEGQHKAGTLICIQGNTGTATFGPHTHNKPTRVKKSGQKLIELDHNDADNTFDPLPYYTGEHAVDIA